MEEEQDYFKRPFVATIKPLEWSKPEDKGHGQFKQVAVTSFGTFTLNYWHRGYPSQLAGFGLVQFLPEGLRVTAWERKGQYADPQSELQSIAFSFYADKVLANLCIINTKENTE